MFSPKIVHWASKMYNWGLQIWGSGGGASPRPSLDPLVWGQSGYLNNMLLTILFMIRSRIFCFLESACFSAKL